MIPIKIKSSISRPPLIFRRNKNPTSILIVIPLASFRSQKAGKDSQGKVNFNGFVKNPSVPLGAGLRFNSAPLDRGKSIGRLAHLDFKEEEPIEKYLTGCNAASHPQRRFLNRPYDDSYARRVTSLAPAEIDPFLTPSRIILRFA
jgi:hypothetical protein